MRLGHRQRRAARRGAENVAAWAEDDADGTDTVSRSDQPLPTAQRPFSRRKVARANAAPGMGAAFLGVTELSRGGKGVRIAVTLLRLEVELPYLMERYQQKGSIQLGEHKASVQAILQRFSSLLIVLLLARNVWLPRYWLVIQKVIQMRPPSLNDILLSERATRFRGWHSAIESMAAANKSTSLLTLKLTTRLDTGEFLQTLDDEARRLQDARAAITMGAVTVAVAV